MFPLPDYNFTFLNLLFTVPVKESTIRLTLHISIFESSPNLPKMNALRFRHFKCLNSFPQTSRYPLPTPTYISSCIPYTTPPPYSPDTLTASLPVSHLRLTHTTSTQYSILYSPKKFLEPSLAPLDLPLYRLLSTRGPHFSPLASGSLSFRGILDNASFNQPHLTLNIIVDASSWDVLSSPIFPFTVMPEITGDLCPTHIDCKFRALPIGSNNVLSGRVGEIAQD
ncbi:hypothetical protein PGT21_028010 [Puccinia graminis f. sp. tritici]|uniref:Uncharacterized protein n=1 Tax=Puccinia graminis f. sp. tritici TaxID=56615 RepID=A0A5B0NPF2_PUCGR|nr:hypothetical protein PGT21_028010 [Puccinia graminis f. sp. tritici]